MNQSERNTSLKSQDIFAMHYGHRDRFHFVPAALQVKLPRDVALRSVHAIHGMSKPGRPGPRATAVAALLMGNWECGARNRFCIFDRTASPLDATDHHGFVNQHQPHFIPNSTFRIPHLGRSPLSCPSLRSLLRPGARTSHRSLSGIHALRDRRNPAAGPVIAATSMHAAGSALSFIYARSKAFWSFKRAIGTSAQCFAAVENQSFRKHRYGGESGQSMNCGPFVFP